MINLCDQVPFAVYYPLQIVTRYRRGPLYCSDLWSRARDSISHYVRRSVRLSVAKNKNEPNWHIKAISVLYRPCT